MSEGPNVFSGDSSVYTPPEDPKLQNAIEANKSQKDKLIYGGMNCERVVEEIAKFCNAAGEHIIQNGNSWITLGRDRPASRASGFGGAGGTRCASIDLVVGRLGGFETYVDNNFKTDAARIYISQKTNIDENFELETGDGSLEHESKSGIGLKADGIRIIGKENIKLVTGPFPEETDTNGEEQTSRYGIDLQSGNDAESLQPIPLGNNLVDCLTTLAERLEDCSSMLESLASKQTDLEDTVSDHTHNMSTGNYGYVLGMQSDMNVSMQNAMSAIDQSCNVDNPMSDHRFNIDDFKSEYLDSGGDKFICSEHNKVN